MIEMATALALGCVTGFFGAMPPGPVSVAVMQNAADGNQKAALQVGFGGATVDTAICTGLAWGASPFMASITAGPAVRIGLSAVYVGLGIFVLAEALIRTRRRPDLRVHRPSEKRASYLLGFFRGAVNPSLIVNWTLVMTALTASGLLMPGRLAGMGFALGVGVGVLSWFSLLAHLVGRAKGPILASWVRAATMVAGALLVVSGSLAAFRALAPHG